MPVARASDARGDAVAEHGRERVKVLYIAGWGRSGSTLVNRVLGEVRGFFAAGELRYLWQRNLVEGHDCGCGRPFAECAVWRGVLARGGIVEQAAAMSRLLEAAATDGRMPSLLARSSARRGLDALGQGARHLATLYRAIRDETGSRVVIDSSKVPVYGYLLSTVPGIDLRVLHLVRDPRAVAYSWRRRKMQGDLGRPMLRRSAVDSGWRWSVRNAEVELLWRRHGARFLRLRYETFVDRPEDSLRQILELVGEPDAELPLSGSRRVVLGPAHTCSGNPNRFHTGEIELHRDDEWRRWMRARDRWAVGLMTWPWLVRYGFEAAGEGERQP